MNDLLISLLERQVAAQEASALAMQQIAERLDLLLEAMAEPDDPEDGPATYMDGSPCR